MLMVVWQSIECVNMYVQCFFFKIYEHLEVLLYTFLKWFLKLYNLYLPIIVHFDINFAIFLEKQFLRILQFFCNWLTFRHILKSFYKGVYACIITSIRTYMHINMTHFHWSVENNLCHTNLPSISVMYHNCTHIFRMNFFISILLK